MDLNYKSWVIIAAALTNLATWHPNTASRQQICRDKFASRFWNQEYNKLASWIPTNQTLSIGSQQQELNYHRCRKEESWNLDIEFSKLATEFKKNFLNNRSKLADAYHAPGSQQRGFGTEGRWILARPMECYKWILPIITTYHLKS
jgi:hypothetical protein